MKLIRKLRNLYALVFILAFSIMVWQGVAHRKEIAFLFGAISLVSFVFLLRQSRLLKDATLILDNRILAVPSDLISLEGDKSKDNMTETVVSTFGILAGSKIYRWGRDGLYGVRLNAVEIDRERMYLTFGDMVQTMRVDLLHGMLKEQEVMNTVNKFLRETGIRASIIGWEHKS